jgi:hypothetical protein
MGDWFMGDCQNTGLVGDRRRVPPSRDGRITSASGRRR